MSRDPATGAYTFSWWGQAGRTYFIQESNDLVNWTYIPVIESGTAAVIQWGFTSSAPTFFVRLRYSDIPTDDPFGADFDGDGVSNWNELLQGTDPLTAALDANGLPLDWEQFYGIPVGTDANLPAPSGDGLTYLEAFQDGVSPTDYYNGVAPTLTLVAGGDQRGSMGSILPVPISVLVTGNQNSSGSGERNAPVTFTVSGGSALIATSPGSLPASSLTTRTSTQSINGLQENVAQVYVVLPNTADDASIITASVVTGGITTAVSTTTATADPTLPLPSGLTATPTGPTTVQLTWTPGDLSHCVTVQVSQDGGVTWQTAGVFLPAVTTLNISGFVPNAPVSFRIFTSSSSNGTPPDPGGDGMTVSLALFSGGPPPPANGGGSSATPSATTQPVSDLLMFGELETGSPITPNGAPGLMQNAVTDSHYLVHNRTDVYNDNTPYSYNKSVTLTVDSLTGAQTYTSSGWDQPPSYQEMANFLSFQLSTVVPATTLNATRTSSVTNVQASVVTSCQWYTNTTPNTLITATRTVTDNLSQEFTEAAWKTLVQNQGTLNTGAFTGAAGLPGSTLSAENVFGLMPYFFGSHSTERFGYYFSRARFQWIVNAGSNKTVIWDEQLTPYNAAQGQLSTPSIDNIKTWQSQGACSSPIYVIDPLTTQYDKQGLYTIIPVTAKLVVDANRDGQMSFTDPSIYDADQTSEVQPYTFWLNDDDDTELTADGLQPLEADTTIPPVHVDYTLHQIVSRRNLEDFARLWLDVDGLQAAITAGTVQIGLKWKTVDSGAPAINIYSSADTTGSDSYLKDDGAAFAQISGNYNNAVAGSAGQLTVDNSGTFVLPASFWTGAPQKYLLFEAAGEGKGQLEIVLLDGSGNQLAEGELIWLDLKNIKKMYMRGFAQASDTNLPYAYTGTEVGPGISLVNDPNAANAAQVFQQPWNEEPQCVVFVHGFNISYNDSINYAETLFKRLWWRGYKGRLAAFRWPTFIGVTTYNDSEFMAWNSGGTLKQYVATLPSNYDIDLVAHSMGNAVVGEALKEGMRATHYAMLHAATSASCYSIVSAAASTFTVTNTGVATPDGDPDAVTKSLGYTGWLGAIGGNPVNFFDPNDSVVVSIWDANNSAFKPQRFSAGEVTPWSGLTGYYYDSTAPAGQRLGLTYLLSAGHYVTDPAEAKAYVDFSLTGTIGGGNKQADQTQGGSIPDSVDDRYFGDDHSSEWDRDIQDLTAFFNKLLLKWELPRNP